MVATIHKMKFKNPWAKGGSLFPGHVDEGISKWFNDKNALDNAQAVGSKPREILASEFEEAMKEKTVEERIRKVVKKFNVDDWIATNTIFYLAGITPTFTQGEEPGKTETRKIIVEVSKITWLGDEFEITLRDSQDEFETKYTIYDQEQAVLTVDVEIENGATVEVNDKDSSIAIDTDDISVSKVIPIPLPRVTIDENVLMLNIFGIPIAINLSPQKR